MKFQLFALILFWISITLAIQYDQATWGNGELSSQVNTGVARETVQATGDQRHIVYIADGKDNSRLDSIYRLNSYEDTANMTNKGIKKHGNYLPNTYKISLFRQGAIAHGAEIHSAGDINSTNTIEYSSIGASSSFNVYAQRGTIEEEVVSFLDYRYGLPIHGLPMVQTFTNGSMGIKSHLVDDAILEKDLSDADRLRESLESVDLVGEIARRELPINKTIVSVEDREIPYVDYGSLPAKEMESLLTNTSPEKETTTSRAFLESATRLGIADVGEISDISSPGNGKETNPIDKYFSLPESEQEKLKTKQSSIEALPVAESICSANSSDASNNVSSSPLNEDDSIGIDPDEIPEPEGEIGVDPSDFASTHMPGREPTLETDDTVFVLGDMWPTLETLYPLNKTRNAYRLGGPQQRLGGAFVGRKVRTDDYFTEWKLPLNTNAVKQANATRSIVLTDAGRL